VRDLLRPVIVDLALMRTLRNPRDTTEILDRLQKLCPTTPRRWGRMSAHEMICHLNDGFKLYMGLISAAPPGFPFPSRLLKWGCLWVPIQWPRGFNTVAEVDQERGGTRPVEFERDLGELRTLIKPFAQSRADFSWPAHPYLGRMSVAEWMRLGYLHTDHHFRQFGV